MTSGGLWNYYKDKTDDVDDNASNGKAIKYKTKIIGKTEATLHYQHNHQKDLNHHDHSNHQYFL